VPRNWFCGKLTIHINTDTKIDTTELLQPEPSIFGADIFIAKFKRYIYPKRLRKIISLRGKRFKPDTLEIRISANHYNVIPQSIP
jgi:hypothetical protein